ncbi:hypothetical protein E2C01_029316 [Portunus trituberculatus]|uniref:BED-type domain-containing protein n=1 Tax=Portunus trituberculatus TaxID=210409 RepID=A0A5B7ERW9_PORTR|nr:hypothetical protein [Portunus trituberculatus]
MASERNRTAPEWNYMKLTLFDTVMCLVCKDKLKYNGNTSNMKKYFCSRHSVEYAELKGDADATVPRPYTSAQSTLIEAITRAQPYRTQISSAFHIAFTEEKKRPVKGNIMLK